MVPLGEPLLGTKVEVRDIETGNVVQKGHEGLIWIGNGDSQWCMRPPSLLRSIGGSYRVCLVAGETRWPEDGMRCSGDRGCVNGAGHLVYSGRDDSQVKRWGHRVNLDVIQQVCDGTCSAACISIYCKILALPN